MLMTRVPPRVYCCQHTSTAVPLAPGFVPSGVGTLAGSAVMSVQAPSPVPPAPTRRHCPLSFTSTSITSGSDCRAHVKSTSHDSRCVKPDQTTSIEV